MIDGKKIVLGGREFIAPPAPFACLRKHAEVFEGARAATITIMADVVFAALRRNYPDLSQDEFFEQYLDVGNLREAFRCVMLITGAEEKQPGEDLPSASTGMTSIAC